MKIVKSINENNGRMVLVSGCGGRTDGMYRLEIKHNNKNIKP